MNPILRAELAALRGLFRVRDGRKLLLAQALTSGVLAFGFTMAARELLSPELVAELRAAPAGWPLFRLLFGLALVPGLIGMVSVVLWGSERLLAPSPEGDLLLVAPQPRSAGVLRAFLRLLALSWLGAASMALPGLIVLAVRSGSAAAVAAAPLALLLLCAPLVSGMLCLRLLLMRLFGSPALKRAFRFASEAISLAVVFGIGVFFLSVTRDEGRLSAEALAALPADPRLPFLLQRPAELLAWSAGAPWMWSGLAGTLALVAAAAAALAVAGWIHPVAYEYETAVIERPRGRVAARGGWPRGVAGSVARRELLLFWRQPARWAGFLLLLGFLFWMMSRDDMLQKKLNPAEFYPPESWSWVEGLRLPAGLRQAGVLLGLLTWLQFMLLPSAALQMVLAEKEQWSVLMLSPAPRAQLLLGKLAPLLLMFAVSAAVIAVVPALWLGVSGAGLLGFAAGAPAVGFGLLGVCVLVVPFPSLFLPFFFPLLLRNGLMAMLMLLVVTAVAVPALLLWDQVGDRYRDGGWFRFVPRDWLPEALLLLLWAAALAAGGLGFAWARRNFERLAEPAAA